MRILYILTSLGIGGAEKQVVALAERMAARGHTVALIVLKHADEEWPVKIPVLRLNLRKTPMGILRGLRFAKNFVTLFRPDILHSHTFPANLFTRTLRWMLQGKSSGSASAPRVINTIHNVYEGGWHRMFLYRCTDPLVDQVTAVSAAAAQRFVELRAVPAIKMRVLTNGIDTDAFTPDRSRRKKMRAEMLAGDDFLWLAVGRLAPAKDFPNLLRAFAQLRAARPERPGTSLWIAGEGDRSHVEPGTPHVGSADGVRLLGLRRDIVDLLDAADGFVLSSAWEGLPLAIGEAMAMEKPIVATDVGGVRELVGNAGFVVPAKDSNALAAAMLEVMTLTEKERRVLGRDGRERIVKQFSMNAIAVQWEELYLQTLNGKTA
ncbi:glycosyltransferase [Acidicapsa acidisoli]|uniref:glycosyltransferase n=1 Tax=Acidicapsa acidisoli TaxID=1615681 RepID=UPI0021DFE348|nr:glycosyltransferase [Acidicapsa acidisoli]